MIQLYVRMPGGKFGSSEAEKRSFLASTGAKSAFSMLLTGAWGRSNELVASKKIGTQERAFNISGDEVSRIGRLVEA